MVLNLVANSRGSAILGKIVNSYRIRSKKSRAEIAQLSGISVEYLRLIESGRRVPVREVLGRISSACGLENDVDIRWFYPELHSVLIRDPDNNKYYQFKFVSRVKEARRTTRMKGLGPEKLTGKDYMDHSLIELQSHPDYSAHAHRVVIAVREMTTEELENLTIARGPH